MSSKNKDLGSKWSYFICGLFYQMSGYLAMLFCGAVGGVMLINGAQDAIPMLIPWFFSSAGSLYLATILYEKGDFL